MEIHVFENCSNSTDLKLRIDAKIVTPAEHTTQDGAPVSTAEAGESHIGGRQEASPVPVSSGHTQSSCTGTEADPQAGLKLQTLISEEEYTCIACKMHFEKDPAQGNSFFKFSSRVAFCDILRRRLFSHGASLHPGV